MKLREILASEGIAHQKLAGGFDVEAFNKAMKKAKTAKAQEALFYSTLRPLIAKVPVPEIDDDGFYENSELPGWRKLLTDRLHALGFLQPGAEVAKPRFHQAYHTGEANIYMGEWLAYAVGFHFKFDGTKVWEEKQPVKI